MDTFVARFAWHHLQELFSESDVLKALDILLDSMLDEALE